MTEEQPQVNWDDIDLKTLPKEIQREISHEFPSVNTNKIMSSMIDNYLIADGIPLVPGDDQPKLDKLKKFLLKKIKKTTGVLPTLTVPKVGDNFAQFAFLECKNKTDADAVLSLLEGTKIDKKHTFKMSRLSEFDEYIDFDDNYVAPTFPEYIEPEDHFSWLVDPKGLDQFAVRSDSETEIFWSIRSDGNPPEKVISKQYWAREWIQWSPTGRYLVCRVGDEIQLFAGPNWTLCKKFNVPNLELVSFSPCETYMITLAFYPEKTKEFQESVVIWDLVSQSPVKKFKPIIEEGQPIWPAFEWSHDDRFCSRLHKGFILVYTTNNFELLNGNPIKLHGPCFNHKWSPTDNYLAVFVPDFKNVPAKILLYKMPVMRVVAQCSSMGIHNCNMHWQECGDYLAVKVDRIQKKKLQHIFEIFSIREKDIPVESFVIENHVSAFAWEPVGNRFTLIQAENPDDTRPNASFYELTVKGVKEKFTLTNQPINDLYWAPSGRFICLVGLGTLNGQLIFVDADTGDVTSEAIHSMCNLVLWDPTGRYLATVADNSRGRSENGFRLWSFHGSELLEERRQSLSQFIWRPRPKGLLPKEKIEWLNNPKNFKQFRDKYRREDKFSRDQYLEERLSKRRDIKTSHASFFAEQRRILENDKEKLLALGINIEEPQDYELEVIGQVEL